MTHPATRWGATPPTRERSRISTGSESGVDAGEQPDRSGLVVDDGHEVDLDGADDRERPAGRREGWCRPAGRGTTLVVTALAVR